MDFNSGSKPNLISDKVFKLIEDTKVPRVPNVYENFYANYIEHNIFFFIILIIFALFLAYRYCFKDEEHFRATFNPNVPIEEQESYSHFLPDDIPYNVDGKFVTHQDIYVERDAELKYTPFFKQPEERIDYSGMTNTFKDSLDSQIIHPYGWDNDYNTSTERTMDYMTERNRQNIEDLAQIIHKENNLYPNDKFAKF